jgi:hypothetical protein
LVLASLLAALKSRGFNTWAFVVGLWQASVKELKLKKRGYPPKNVFRRGLNILCRLVTNFEHFDLIVWRKVIKLLALWEFAWYAPYLVPHSPKRR